MKNATLLTVSGNIPLDISTQIARGDRPVADFIAMSRAFSADLIDYAKAQQESGKFGWLLNRIGGQNLVLAWACFRLRKQYQVIFFDGEQVGIPYAILLKFFGGRAHPRHLMIAHILSVRKKILLFDLFQLQHKIETYFVYSTWQKQFIQTHWKVPPKQVVYTPFMVDTDFFSPHRPVEPLDLAAYNPHGYPVICSAGLERRDYQTLIEAVRGLDVFVVIAAASPWAKQKNMIGSVDIPENVHIQKFSQYDLRRLYACSRFVVMPLQNVNFQAGVTAILEAMAMAKAVICTRTAGQTDVVVDHQTGFYVPPADADALRAAIRTMLTNCEETEWMGQNGRRRVEQEMSLHCYTRRLKAFIENK